MNGRRKYQGGQAAILALAALAVLVSVTLVVFNMGQLTHSKAQTMNAADAAAYAAANTLARDMNFMAYTNRAIVANHVAVGQMVSYTSLTLMLVDGVENLSTVAQFIPYIGAVFRALKQVAQRIEDILPKVMRVIVDIQGGLITALHGSQTAMRVLTAVDAYENVESVIKANDPNIEWDTGSLGGLLGVKSSVDMFLSYSKNQTSDTYKNKQRQVVYDSLDKFVPKRGKYWSFNVGILKGQGWGGTDLTPDNKRWVGLDAYTTYDRSRFRWKENSPLAKGGAQANSSYPDGWTLSPYGGMSRKARNSAFNSRKELGTLYNGLQGYYEVDDKYIKMEDKDLPAFIVMTRKSISAASKTQTSDKLLNTGAEDNPYRLHEGKDQVKSIAASQVYFKRPLVTQDPDFNILGNRLQKQGKYKNGTYATLFSPYWQPRLTELPSAYAAALLALE